MATDLSVQEREALVFAPFVVFYVVAYADGKISPPESATFASVLKQATTLGPEYPIIKSIMADAHNNFGSILNQINNQVGGGLTFDAILNRAVSAADSRLSRDEALTYKQLLLRIGEMIADAWPLFGNSTSPAERAALSTLRSLLGL